MILNNLYRVYGDKLPKQESVLLHEIYKNFVFLWMEFLQMHHLNERTADKLVRIKSRELLESVKNRDRGIIFVAGHFGNFEWMGQAFVLQKLPMAAIAKKQSNLKVDAFVNKMRCRYGLKVIYTYEAMQVATKFLKDKKNVAIAIDQDARKRGVFVNFLGLPSSTAVGAAVLHLRTGARIILLVPVRRDYALFDVYMEEITVPELNGKLQEKVIAITQLHTSAFERWVRKYPEQWFWVHRRWKTQPGN